jgi:hypothetical protein
MQLPTWLVLASRSPLDRHACARAQVVYEDGDEEQLRVGLDVPVRVDLGPQQGAALPQAPPDMLMQLVGLLLAEAEQAAQDAAALGTSSTRQRELHKQGESALRAAEVWLVPGAW